TLIYATLLPIYFTAAYKRVCKLGLVPPRVPELIACGRSVTPRTGRFLAAKASIANIAAAEIVIFLAYSRSIPGCSKRQKVQAAALMAGTHGQETADACPRMRVGIKR